MQTTVEAKVSVPGFHAWPGAIPEVAYLAHSHRHVFVFRAGKEVTHGDREVEFILLGGEVLRCLESRFTRDENGIFQFGANSCEHLAAMLVEALELVWCSVHEDDENGAVVTA